MKEEPVAFPDTWGREKKLLDPYLLWSEVVGAGVPWFCGVLLSPWTLGMELRLSDLPGKCLHLLSHFTSSG